MGKEGLILGPEIDFLLPSDGIRINSYADRKARLIGEMLDSIAPKHLEWYGYLLREFGSGQIDDIIIQQKQVASRYDVRFDASAYRYFQNELDSKNLAEERMGERILLPTGIVHRHGFEKGVPVNSKHKDVPNLRNYANHNYPLNMLLADNRNLLTSSGYVIELDGSKLLLNHLSGEGVDIEITLSEEKMAKAFLQVNGIDPKLMERFGGLNGFLADYARFGTEVNTYQKIYSSHAESLIYNQDGSKVFGEIYIIAAGHVIGRYEKAFEVPVNIVDDEKGRTIDEGKLFDEVRTKISWVKEKIHTTSRRRQKASLLPSWDAELDNFYHHASIYINSSKEAKYSRYVSELMGKISSGIRIEDAVIELGRLYDSSGDVLRSNFSKNLIVGNITRSNELVRSFKGSLEDMTASLEKYVGGVLGG